jgi:serine protease 16
MDWTGKGSPFGSAWGYQVCNEFGFYQTCEEGTRCFYVQGLISFNDSTHKPNDFCLKQFGISPAEQQARIEATNVYYGGDKPNGDLYIVPSTSVYVLVLSLHT